MPSRDETRTPLLFLALVAALSAPFYILGKRSLFPEGMTFFPASALMAWMPLVVAVGLTWRAGGWRAARGLLGRAIDPRRTPILWFLPVFLILPVTIHLAYMLSTAFGADLPPAQPIWAHPLASLSMFGFLLLFAMGEEVGWSGYATEPLQARWGALPAALALGLFGGLWHVVPYFNLGHDAHWVFWQVVCTVLQRVIIVWIFNNTARSLFAVECFHAMFNVSYRIFPDHGSLYDPFTTSLVLGVVVIAIWAFWGPSLASRRVRTPSAA